MATVTNAEPHYSKRTQPPGPPVVGRLRTLSEFLRDGRPPLAAACEIGVQLCDELMRHPQHIAATVGVNPNNVRLQTLASGELKLSLPNSPPRTTTFTDTPAGVQWLSDSPRRIPPEVLDGRTADSRSEVYVVGVVLYELLSGLPLTESQGSIGYGDWETLIDHNPLIPEPLLRAVESALESDPRERLRSPAEFIRQLLPYLPDDSEIRAAAERRLSVDSFHDDENSVMSTPSPSLLLERAPKPRKLGQPPKGQLISPTFPKSPATPSQLRIPDGMQAMAMPSSPTDSGDAQAPLDRHALRPSETHFGVGGVASLPGTNATRSRAPHPYASPAEQCVHPDQLPTADRPVTTLLIAALGISLGLVLAMFTAF